VDQNLFTCAQDTQDKMKEVIEEQGLNRVVVAACSPITHQALFQETIREAGLNKYLFEMANIRDQNTWVHMSDPAQATEKAKDLVRMAVAKSVHIEPLHEVLLEVKRAALVIGGGAAGMEAALGIARQGFKAFLVEKSGELGGMARKIHTTWQGENVQSYLNDLIVKLEHHPNVRLFLNTETAATTGSIGSFTTKLVSRGETDSSTVIEHGVTILATGGREYKPNEYFYGRHPGVMTHLEFDEAVVRGDERIQTAATAVFIQCVGSRNSERPYCSRVCCTHSLKSALALKKMNPEINVFILYRDIRSYGFREELYIRAREKGVLFVRYDPESPPKVELETQDRLALTVTDHILGLLLDMNPDLLILAAAVLPNENKKLFELFKVPVNADGFLVEAHAKLRPVDFASEGIFMAGLAHYPKSIDETIAQARAAVSRAATILSQEGIRAGGVVADVVYPDRCAACLACVRSCPYGVPYIKDSRAFIQPSECHGCGVCAAECPRKVITLQHFTDDQINAKIHAMIEKEA